MGWLKNLTQKIAESPGNKIAVKADPLFAGAFTKTLTHATAAGWGKPLGKDASGLDYLGAGPVYYGSGGKLGGNPDKPRDRAVGRAVGSFFAGEGVSAAAGAGADATAASSTSSLEEGGAETLSEDGTTAAIEDSTADETIEASAGSAGAPAASSSSSTVSEIFGTAKQAIGAYSAIQALRAGRRSAASSAEADGVYRQGSLARRTPFPGTSSSSSSGGTSSGGTSSVAKNAAAAVALALAALGALAAFS